MPYYTVVYVVVLISGQTLRALVVLRQTESMVLKNGGPKQDKRHLLLNGKTSLRTASALHGSLAETHIKDMESQIPQYTT